MGDGKTDADLVREALSGRAGAYALLVHRWSARVLAVCHGRVGNASTAEDLAQETLLRALRSLASIREPERFGSWICGIATRTCLDWLKSKQRTEVSIDHAQSLADEIPSHGESSNDSWDQLYQEIEQLPAECREVLMLYYYSDSTYQELAAMLEVSAATVNARLTKARKLLRHRLSGAGS